MKSVWSTNQPQSHCYLVHIKRARGNLTCGTSRRCIGGILLASAGHRNFRDEPDLANPIIRSSGGVRGHKRPGVSSVELEVEEVAVTRTEPPPTFVKAPGRVIAIGDLHGDLAKTLHALKLSQVLREDEEGNPIWCGGDTTVVQLGDVLDRGDCEIGILMLLRDLGRQAEKDGGAVYMVNGNHESLNVCGNFRYVTKGAFYESALAAGTDRAEAGVWENQLISRVALYSPGGLVAQELAKNPTVLVVNDTVFAHGGLLPAHVEYGIEKINAEMAAWMRGDVLIDGSKATPPYIAMGGPNSIMWNRTFGQEKFPSAYEKFYACSMLKSTLANLNSKRLVVGHTPQITGCNCECSGQIWRTDVGMSSGVLNAQPQVLSIDKDENGTTEIEVMLEKLAKEHPGRSLLNRFRNGKAKGSFSMEFVKTRIQIHKSM